MGRFYWTRLVFIFIGQLYRQRLPRRDSTVVLANCSLSGVIGSNASTGELAVVSHELCLRA